MTRIRARDLFIGAARAVFTEPPNDSERHSEEPTGANRQGLSRRLPVDSPGRPTGKPKTYRYEADGLLIDVEPPDGDQGGRRRLRRRVGPRVNRSRTT
jgi:hypothetical protein